MHPSDLFTHRGCGVLLRAADLTPDWMSIAVNDKKKAFCCSLARLCYLFMCALAPRFSQPCGCQMFTQWKSGLVDLPPSLQSSIYPPIPQPGHWSVSQFLPCHPLVLRTQPAFLLCVVTLFLPLVLFFQLSIPGTAADPSNSSHRWRAIYLCTGNTPENQLQWPRGPAQGHTRWSSWPWKTNRYVYNCGIFLNLFMLRIWQKISELCLNSTKLLPKKSQGGSSHLWKGPAAL